MLVGRRWKLLLSVTDNLALCYDLFLFVILSMTPISSAILHPYHHHPLKSRLPMRYYSSQRNFAVSLGDMTPGGHRAAIVANSKLEKRYSALAANILMLRNPPHPPHQLRHNSDNINNVMFTNSRVEEATSVYTDNSNLIRRRHRKRNVDMSSLETDSDVLYASAERTCSHFRSKEVLLCNGHDRAYKCVCKASFSQDSQIITQETSDDGVHFQRQVPYCDSPNVLPYLNNAAENILTIGIGFPVPEEFLRQPDEIFAEDIEIFAFIKMETVVIYRKGCNADESAFEFQFGILHENYSSSSGDAPQTTRRRLRTLSPEIFLSNPIFMKQQGLNIKYVKYTDNLRPIFDNSEEELTPRSRKRKSLDFSSGVDSRFLITRKSKMVEPTRLPEEESWRNSLSVGLMTTSFLILLGLCCSCLYFLFSRKHCSQTHLRV